MLPDKQAQPHTPPTQHTSLSQQHSSSSFSTSSSSSSHPSSSVILLPVVESCSFDSSPAARVVSHTQRKPTTNSQNTEKTSNHSNQASSTSIFNSCSFSCMSDNSSSSCGLALAHAVHSSVCIDVSSSVSTTSSSALHSAAANVALSSAHSSTVCSSPPTTSLLCIPPSVCSSSVVGLLGVKRKQRSSASSRAGKQQSQHAATLKREHKSTPPVSRPRRARAPPVSRHPHPASSSQHAHARSRQRRTHNSCHICKCSYDGSINHFRCSCGLLYCSRPRCLKRLGNWENAIRNMHGECLHCISERTGEFLCYNSNCGKKLARPSKVRKYRVGRKQQEGGFEIPATKHTQNEHTDYTHQQSPDPNPTAPALPSSPPPTTSSSHPPARQHDDLTFNPSLNLNLPASLPLNPHEWSSSHVLTFIKLYFSRMQPSFESSPLTGAQLMQLDRGECAARGDVDDALFKSLKVWKSNKEQQQHTATTVKQLPPEPVPNLPGDGLVLKSSVSLPSAYPSYASSYPNSNVMPTRQGAFQPTQMFPVFTPHSTFQQQIITQQFHNQQQQPLQPPVFHPEPWTDLHPSHPNHASNHIRPPHVPLLHPPHPSLQSHLHHPPPISHIATSISLPYTSSFPPYPVYPQFQPFHPSHPVGSLALPPPLPPPPPLSVAALHQYAPPLLSPPAHLQLQAPLPRQAQPAHIRQSAQHALSHQRLSDHNIKTFRTIQAHTQQQQSQAPDKKPMNSSRPHVAQSPPSSQQASGMQTFTQSTTVLSNVQSIGAPSHNECDSSSSTHSMMHSRVASSLSSSLCSTMSPSSPSLYSPAYTSAPAPSFHTHRDSDNNTNAPIALSITTFSVSPQPRFHTQTTTGNSSQAKK